MTTSGVWQVACSGISTENDHAGLTIEHFQLIVLVLVHKLFGSLYLHCREPHFLAFSKSYEPTARHNMPSGKHQTNLSW